MNLESREKLSNIAYYLIIAIVSILAMTFIPMVGTSIGLEWELPDSVAGWVVWCVTKISTALLNMLLFHCFLLQAKINVRGNAKYIEAKELLSRATIKKKVKPLSPKKWTAKQYLGKGTTIFLLSLLSVIGFSQALLTFDILIFMSLAFTVIMGVIFGYINMRKAEEYWTGEFYEYAVMTHNEILEKEKQDGEMQQSSDASLSESTEH